MCLNPNMFAYTEIYIYIYIYIYIFICSYMYIYNVANIEPSQSPILGESFYNILHHPKCSFRGISEAQTLIVCRVPFVKVDMEQLSLEHVLDDGAKQGQYATHFQTFSGDRCRCGYGVYSPCFMWSSQIGNEDKHDGTLRVYDIFRGTHTGTSQK